MAFETPATFVKHPKELKTFSFDKGKHVSKTTTLSSGNREEWATMASFEPETVIRKHWKTKDYDNSWKDLIRRFGGFLGIQTMLKRNPLHFLANYKSSYFTYDHLRTITTEQMKAFEGDPSKDAPVTKKVKHLTFSSLNFYPLHARSAYVSSVPTFILLASGGCLSSLCPPLSS